MQYIKYAVWTISYPFQKKLPTSLSLINDFVIYIHLSGYTYIIIVAKKGCTNYVVETSGLQDVFFQPYH